MKCLAKVDACGAFFRAAARLTISISSSMTRRRDFLARQFLWLSSQLTASSEK